MAKETEEEVTETETTSTEPEKTDTTTSTEPAATETTPQSGEEKPAGTSTPAGSNPGEDYDFSDYGIFGDAASLTSAYNTKLAAINDEISQGKAKINDDGVFMGPIKDNFMEVFGKIDSQMSETTSNFNSIGTYLKDASVAYKNGDTDAKNVTLSLSGQSVNLGSGLAGTPVSSITIPSDIKQSGYTVTCYGPDGWHYGGAAEAKSVAAGTDQEKVHEKWKADGARYKNGIAVMNVNGQDCYLIATSSAVGKVGDVVNVNFENGQSIPCVVADQKSSNDNNYTRYGHQQPDGSINVLEFEVDTATYNAKKNPTTSTWGLEWDSSSRVTQVDNYGRAV